ncbi:MAG: hypothetical protein RIS76_2032 [Verrucomicrobiota bacterium]
MNGTRDHGVHAVEGEHPVKTAGETLKSRGDLRDWLPDMDLNHDKQIQRLLCYRYTIGQAGSAPKVVR